MNPNDTFQADKPTDESPAITQTETTQAGTAATETQPLDHQDSPSAPDTSSSEHLGSKPRRAHKGLFIAIITAAVVGIALVFLLLSPWSPFVSAAPGGPQLFVGKQQYVQACGVLDRETIDKELSIKLDPNRESVNEITAYDPANSKDSSVDLTKQSGAQSVFSTCSLIVNNGQTGKDGSQEGSPSIINLSIEQFPEPKKAQAAFKADKQSAPDVKTLPSYANDSYYSMPSSGAEQINLQNSGSGQTIQPRVLHNNLIIGVTLPSDASDGTSQKTVGEVDKLVKDIIGRIDNGEGKKMKNFNGANKLNGNSFTDACRSVNYAKIASIMGNGTELYGQSVSGSQLYAPDNSSKTATQIISACTFSFRTQAEVSSAKDLKSDPFTTSNGQAYAGKFPHFLSLQIAVTENKASAQKYLASAKEKLKASTNEEQVTKTENLSLGDGGMRVTLQRAYPAEDSGQSGTVSKGQLYYVTNGPNIYVFSTTYVQQDKPFKSVAREISVDQFTQIYKELTLATKRARQ